METGQLTRWTCALMNYACSYLCGVKWCTWRPLFQDRQKRNVSLTSYFPFSIFSYRNVGMKQQWKSVLNFEVHSQLFLCVEQLVALKENQINSQWKRWDIKSTWGKFSEIFGWKCEFRCCPRLSCERGSQFSSSELLYKQYYSGPQIAKMFLCNWGMAPNSPCPCVWCVWCNLP